MNSGTFKRTLQSLLFTAVVLPLAAQDAPPAPRPLNPVSTADASGTYGDVVLEGDATFPNAGVLLRAKAARADVVAQTGSSAATSGFIVFNSANAELLRVRNDGVLILGGAVGSPWDTGLSPAIEHIDTSIAFGNDTDLHLVSNAYSAGSWRYKTNDLAADYYLYKGVHGWRVAPAGAADAALTWSEAMRITNAGDVGIGTTTPAAKLAVNGGTTPFRVTAANSLGFGVNFRDLQATEGYGSGVLMEMQGNSMIRVGNLQIGRTTYPMIDSTGMPLSLNSNLAQDVVIGAPAFATALQVRSTGTSTFAGSVTIGGDVTVTGNIAAKYQDVAEWVISDSDLAPGTVVVLGRDRVNTVTAATEPFDTRVAGVVSERPGLILGEAGPEKEMIATTGRVRVRVDASNQSIAIGDLLVTSNRRGVAMKSTPVDVAGIQMHRPGTIIGKALEPLATGEGEILVLLSLQ